jgi:hypothetical protein
MKIIIPSMTTQAIDEPNLRSKYNKNEIKTKTFLSRLKSYIFK